MKSQDNDHTVEDILQDTACQMAVDLVVLVVEKCKDSNYLLDQNFVVESWALSLQIVGKELEVQCYSERVTHKCE